MTCCLGDWLGTDSKATKALRSDTELWKLHPDPQKGKESENALDIAVGEKKKKKRIGRAFMLTCSINGF